eukprot:scaffold2183_cov185-Skeletonema_marinoi.AAC.4
MVLESIAGGQPKPKSKLVPYVADVSATSISGGIYSVMLSYRLRHNYWAARSCSLRLATFVRYDTYAYHTGTVIRYLHTKAKRKMEI